jgi:hypothetical protein
MKQGFAIWSVYFGGYVAATAINYDIDGVILAYTPQSSVARSAVEAFAKRHREHEERLYDTPDNANVTVQFASNGKTYSIRKILEGDQVIYQAIDTPEEFWYIFQKFGLDSEFTCDDILKSGSLDVDPQALRKFVGKQIVPVPLNNLAPLERALFFGVLIEHYAKDSALLQRAWRDAEAVRDGRIIWPEGDREVLRDHVDHWFGLNVEEKSEAGGDSKDDGEGELSDRPTSTQYPDYVERR